MAETNHQPPPGDRLDRAAAAVRRAAVPPPPADLLAATVAAVHNRLTLAEAADVARRRRRRLVMRYASVGGLAAAVAVAAGVLWGGGRADGAEALRAALDHAAAAKSVRVTQYEERGGAVVAVSEQYQMGRLERTEFFHQRGPEGRPTADVAVWTHDWDAKRSLYVHPRHRMARREPLTAEAGEPGGILSRLARMRQALTDGKAAPYRAAPDEVVAGRRMTVFATGDPAAGKVWLDATTGRLARIGGIDPKFNAFVGNVFDRWDEVFDPRLFSLDPPAGFRVSGEPPAAEASPEKTHPVSLTLAAEAVAAAPCMVVTNTQRLLPGRPELVVKMYARRTQFRMEFPNPGGNGLPDPKAVPAIGAIVFDADNDRSLHLNFGEKTAKFEKRQGLRPATFPDLVAGFRRLKDEDGEAAGEEAVDGKPAKVFKVKNADFIGAKGPGLVTTVWLDAATSLPVKVRVTDGTVDLRFDRFEWPATLSDRLFSLVPPKGYAVGEFVPPAPPQVVTPAKK